MNESTYRKRSFWRFPREFGITPIKLFIYRSKLTKFVKLPSSAGIWPLILLLYSSLLSMSSQSKGPSRKANRKTENINFHWCSVKIKIRLKFSVMILRGFRFSIKIRPLLFLRYHSNVAVGPFSLLNKYPGTYWFKIHETYCALKELSLCLPNKRKYNLQVLQILQ